jgi:hypothetical protein
MNVVSSVIFLILLLIAVGCGVSTSQNEKVSNELGQTKREIDNLNNTNDAESEELKKLKKVLLEEQSAQSELEDAVKSKKAARDELEIKKAKVAAGESIIDDNHQLILTPPTSDYLAVNGKSGNLVSLNELGIMIKYKYNYLPRINYDECTETELSLLLETKVGYAALTTFGNQEKRSEQSSIYEATMRQIWENEKTLRDKIQTRITLLKLMREYNSAVTDSIQFHNLSQNSSAQLQSLGANMAGVQGAVQANHEEHDQNAQITLDAGKSNIEITDFNSRQSKLAKQEKSLQKEADAIAVQQAGVQAQEAMAAQMAGSKAGLARAKAQKLREMGLVIMGDMLLIPPLKMQSEVDEVRVRGEQ